ncbi:T9SS type B sorting domain-containing protein [Flavobacterium sp. Sd200]|uniref:T9SS type B sorting domain-containing protein n=1 Tax=Flavobacterium sp. Sd200 TaxID=2692211 RepID=UPI00136A6561|nr:T9SS type B sorting domain-containing protein [Flavobacterium sp. Sd200]MXN90878.1 T9SS type B sorting domain-containing protein [Flavobacterium sp. Sd200]
MMKLLLFKIILIKLVMVPDPVKNAYRVENDTAILKSFLRDEIVSCDPFITLRNPEENNSYLYWAENSINVSNNYIITENSASNITMKAGKQIVLRGKTVIKRGNSYLARIEPCEPPCKSTYTYSKYFTPNHDGINDYWTIKDISNMTNVNVTIYDRYGKLIKKINPLKERGWDGKFNSEALFATDYWFVLTYTDCNGMFMEVKSHFSLLR